MEFFSVKIKLKKVHQNDVDSTSIKIASKKYIGTTSNFHSANQCCIRFANKKSQVLKLKNNIGGFYATPNFKGHEHSHTL